jgi:hypothetical protein
MTWRKKDKLLFVDVVFIINKLLIPLHPPIQSRSVDWTLNIFACLHIQIGVPIWSLVWGDFTLKRKAMAYVAI